MKIEDLKDPDRPYVANITLRHVKQRTAAIYARNPKYRFLRSKRLYHQLWDGTAETLQAAMATISEARQMAVDDPMAPPPDICGLLRQAACFWPSRSIGCASQPWQ